MAFRNLRVHAEHAKNRARVPSDQFCIFRLRARRKTRVRRCQHGADTGHSRDFIAVSADEWILRGGRTAQAQARQMSKPFRTPRPVVTPESWRKLHASTTKSHKLDFLVSVTTCHPTHRLASCSPPPDSPRHNNTTRLFPAFHTVRGNACPSWLKVKLDVQLRQALVCLFFDRDDSCACVRCVARSGIRPRLQQHLLQLRHEWRWYGLR